MERDELSDWLRLSLGAGPSTARRLLAAFGLPGAVLSQSSTALSQLLTPAQLSALTQVPDGFEAQAAATWQWLTEAGPTPRRIVTLGDAAYPPSLLLIEDPPPLLYLTGRVDLPCDAARSIAIVGSRNPTPQGEGNAREFARALARGGLTVVSGLALGVDGAAHQGALDGAGDASTRLATVAVVGTGPDRVYPKRHLQLAHRIAEQGLIVSEYPLGTPPLAQNFPRRNRLISALSQGTLVVEAALESGSLITAQFALEQGREVFAIPGSIHSPQSRGCHKLIRQGAKLVESAQDVFEELRLPAGDARSGATTRHRAAEPELPEPPEHVDDSAAPSAQDEAQAPADPRRALLRALGYDPVSLDALVARLGESPQTLLARLLELELEGEVARLPGGLYQRRADA